MSLSDCIFYKIKETFRGGIYNPLNPSDYAIENKIIFTISQDRQFPNPYFIRGPRIL
jgi:hypothetical protein